MCRGFGLCKHSSDRIDLKEPRCWAWTCEDCAPVRRYLLIDEIHRGDPSKFVTLTWRWVEGMVPAAETTKMLKAFGKLVKLLRKYHAGHEVEYWWGLEPTQQGAPHMHLAMRMPYTPKNDLKAMWFKLTGSYILDIQDMRTFKEKAAYIIKYIGKTLHKFGTHKRYGKSRKYIVDPRPKDQTVLVFGEQPWERVRVNINEYKLTLHYEGCWLEPLDKRHTRAYRQGYWPAHARDGPRVALWHQKQRILGEWLGHENT